MLSLSRYNGGGSAQGVPVISQVDLAMLGAFPGHDTTLDECEAKLWLFWPDKERKREPGLFAEKWWDYRGLTPVHATYLFSHMLTQQVRALIRTHIDPTPPRVTRDGTILDWNPIKAGDVFEPPSTGKVAYWRRKMHGLIRARQQADADGIPYDAFIAAALKHFYFGRGTYVMQRNDQGGARTVIPEPNLFYGEDCLAFIRETWLGLLGTRVHPADHPRYLTRNDDGHPDHAAHREWLRQQLDNRAVQTWAAAGLVKRGLLTPRQAAGMVRDPMDLVRKLQADLAKSP